MLKGAIFDMDGVIIDSEPIHYKIFQKYSEELGFKLLDEEYNTFIGSTNLVMYTALREKFNLKQEVEELIKTYEKRCSEYYNNAEEKPIDSVDVLIKELYLNNIKLAVASSSSINSINSVVKLFNLRGYFNKLISGSGLDNPKPAPDVFLIAARELGIEPGECVVIEDSKNGVTAAKAAGMKCIGFRNPNSGNQDISGADLIIDSFSDINTNIINTLFV